jgi:hypothetical protein
MISTETFLISTSIKNPVFWKLLTLRCVYICANASDGRKKYFSASPVWLTPTRNGTAYYRTPSVTLYKILYNSGLRAGAVTFIILGFIVTLSINDSPH